MEGLSALGLVCKREKTLSIQAGITFFSISKKQKKGDQLEEGFN
jgi:hypothetical protein